MPDELERIKQINSSDGRFNRFVSTFRNFVTEEDPFKPAKGRYHLYVAYACPWAHRALIARKLKGLEDIIDVSVTSPNWGPNGWPFYSSDPYPGSTTDPINNAAFVKDLYLKASPSYEGRYTIPVLWDKEQETIVNNESSEILRIFNEGFDGVEGKGESVDLYPKDLRKEIDEVNEWIYEKINNGVYKCGIAKAQEAYDENIGSLFDGLDRVEKLLKESGSEFLVGNRLTEADVRLFTTIVRGLLFFLQEGGMLKDIGYDGRSGSTQCMWDISSATSEISGMGILISTDG